MHALGTLPEGYEPILTVDLQKDRNKALCINGIAMAIAVIMVVLMLPIVPIRRLFAMESGLLEYIARFLVLAVGSVAYILLHEAVHGVFMKHFSGQRARYGFVLPYAYAGSDAYFDKKSYQIIALAPVVVWGLVLAVLSLVVSDTWFWVVYTIQISNLSGAAGDYYVFWKFRTLPADIYIQDTGVSMTVYSKDKKTDLPG